MNKLQNLFVALVNMDIFPDDTIIKFIRYGLLEWFMLQHCENIFVHTDITSFYR